jgi:aubergine
MLLSKSKAREMRAGAPQMVYLVPELCRMTGLTDDMRSNFQLMKAIADHTRSSPSQRVNKLVAFANRLLENRSVNLLLIFLAALQK